MAIDDPRESSGAPRLPLDRSLTRRGVIGAGLGLAAGAAPTRSAADEAANLPPAVPKWQREPGAPVMSPPYGLP